MSETEVKYLAKLLKMKVVNCNTAPIEELKTLQMRGIHTLRK